MGRIQIMCKHVRADKDYLNMSCSGWAFLNRQPETVTYCRPYVELWIFSRWQKVDSNKFRNKHHALDDVKILEVWCFM